MKLLTLSSVAVLALACTTALAGFTPNRIVVLQTVDSSAGGPGTLIEYTKTGTASFSVALPGDASTNSATSIVFGNLSGNANQTLNHGISLSADGALVVVGGFGNSAPSVDASPGSTSPRVVATVNYNGVYARPFSSQTVLTVATIRSTTSDGFGNFWGHGSTVATYFNGNAPIGTGACRAIAVVNGNICYTKAPTGLFGVYQVVGLPFGTTSETRIMDSSLMGTGSTPGGFAIPTIPVVGSIAYLTDYNGSPNRGIGHYHWDGSAWVWDYNLLLAGTKPQHIAVDYSGANPFVYVTPTGSVGNNLYAFDDTNSTAVRITIATAAAGTVFRGVAMSPTQPALPVFTVNPTNQTNNYGGSVTFGPVSASAANPNAWTWKKGSTTLNDGPTGSGSTISGAHTDTLTVSVIGGADTGNYFAVASNNGGSINSSAAILGLAGSSITTQLVSRTNAAGTTATFHVVSSGPPTLSYAWTHDGNPLGDGLTGTGSTISGSTTDTLSISGVQDGDAGLYSVTVTDGSSAQSVSAATLTVADQPQISTQPVNLDRAAGTSGSFSVEATGNALSYQWFRGATRLTNGPSGFGSTLSGATSTNLSLSNIQTGDAATYTVTITNVAGTITSDPATLTVGLPPTIGPMPDATNVIGTSVTFAPSISGTAPLTYTWKHNNVTISADSTLTLGSVSETDAQLYSLTVVNAYGSKTASAHLYVITDTNKPNDVPNLIVYEPFNYPNGGTSIPTGGFYSWENLISIYNRITGQPAFWFNCGGLNSGITANQFTDYGGVTREPPGQYPWPGIDSGSPHEWTFAGGGNNNHLKFGGVTNGSAYFSLILHGDQGSAIANNDTYDVIAGFTSGDSTAALNGNTWNYKLCTKTADAGDFYQLGVFKGNGNLISGSSVNGQFSPVLLKRGQLHFIVGCYKINSGIATTNDDVVSLWIDPPTSAFGASEASVPTPSVGGMLTNWNNNAAVTEFGIRASGAAPFSKKLADLRIGKTWASVTGPYFPTLKQVPVSPDTTTLVWRAKDSFNGFGYQLHTAPAVNGPYTLDGNSASLDDTNNVVTETPSAPQFWRLVYPPRAGYGLP
jgi:hypothetical protein